MNSSPLSSRLPAAHGVVRAHLIDGNSTMPVNTRLLGREGGALYLESKSSVPEGAALRIDVDGGVVLGVVSASEPGEGGRLLAVRIDRVIPTLPDLARLVQRVMSESQSPVVKDQANANTRSSGTSCNLSKPHA